MLRKSLISSLIVLLWLGLLWPGLLSASSLLTSTLSTNDWTYDAIESLVRSREIPGFSVPSEMNRNQGALLVARLLQHLSGDENAESRRFGVSKNVYLDNMIFTYNQKVTPDRALAANQVELLYRLVLEFHTELEILGYSIQDFNLLYSQGWSKDTDGLFARKPLLYSEQALAAARKLEEERSPSANEGSRNGPDQQIAEIMPAPIEPKNLWTAQFSSASRFLPPPASISMPESELELSKAIQIGGMEVSGGLRPGSTSPVEPNSSEEGVAGYGISFKVGDLAVKTALDLVVDPSLVPSKATTSVDLSLDWADLFTFNAGFKQLERFHGDASDAPLSPVVTSLGVSVPITRGQVHLGMTQEWGKFGSQEGSPLPGGEVSSGDVGPKSTAELGLKYELPNDSSLRFYYHLIDFSNVEQENHKATAEFSIKF